MARKNVMETADKAVEEKENVIEIVDNAVEEKENVPGTEELSFSKQAFLSSKTYKPHKDLLETLLEKGKSYTKSEVNKLIDDYLKGRVM